MATKHFDLAYICARKEVSSMRFTSEVQLSVKQLKAQQDALKSMHDSCIRQLILMRKQAREWERIIHEARSAYSSFIRSDILMRDYSHEYRRFINRLHGIHR